MKTIKKPVAKFHLMPDGGVVKRFEMLTYWRVRSAFKPFYALPSDII
jgi:hypothetical protein